MRKIYFRADANVNIGYGHFVRTLALADMLKEDFDCTFFTQNPTPYQIGEMEKVCPYVVLNEETKFEDFLEIIKGDEIVVLDNYFYTSEYQKKIKARGCKLVLIDDLHDRHICADAIINHCVDTPLEYDAEKYTRFYMGAKWALLRKPFMETEECTHTQNHWVITFGGSDLHNLTQRYVDYLIQSTTDCKISLLLGDGYAHFEDFKSYPNVTIYRNQTAQQVAELFRSAESVICSASSVCYEALSCGCRIFAGYYVNNQIDFYHTLNGQGLICPLGNLLEETPNINFEYQSKAEISFSDIVIRYRSIFRALAMDVVEYPSLTHEQSCQTWECRNRPEIRECMTNPNAFSFESHEGFVTNLTSKTDKLYYSFFDKDVFVGSYDFIDIIDGESAERGLFVNPDYQGNHVGTMMEYFLEGEIIKRGVHELLAEVLKVNERSYKFHLKLGYKVYREDAKYFYLKRNI